MVQELLKSARSKVVGAKETLKVLERGEARLVFLARDADEKISRPVAVLAEKRGVEIRYVDSMKELGTMCGIKVGAASAAITEL